MDQTTLSNVSGAVLAFMQRCGKAQINLLEIAEVADATAGRVLYAATAEYACVLPAGTSPIMQVGNGDTYTWRIHNPFYRQDIPEQFPARPRPGFQRLRQWLRAA